MEPVPSPQGAVGFEGESERLMDTNAKPLTLDEFRRAWEGHPQSHDPYDIDTVMNDLTETYGADALMLALREAHSLNLTFPVPGANRIRRTWNPKTLAHILYASSDEVDRHITELETQLEAFNSVNDLVGAELAQHNSSKFLHEGFEQAWAVAGWRVAGLNVTEAKVAAALSPKTT